VNIGDLLAGRARTAAGARLAAACC
jgi:hypothetical protein